MSDEKVRFTGDSTSLVQAADRGTKAIQRQEQAVRGAAKAGKDLGQELGQTFAGMAKGVLVTAAITKSLEAAAEAAETLRKAGAARSEQKGKEAVEVERALMPSGMTAQERQSILGMVGEGTTKAEDTAGFIQALAKKKGKRLTYADTLRATQAFTSGAYSQEELLDARTLPTLQEQQEKLGSMSEEARRELRIRAKQRTQEAVTRNAAAANPYARYVDEEIQRRKIENPMLQAGMEGIKSLPGVGKLAAEGEAFMIQLQQMRRAKEDRSATLRLAPDQIDRQRQPEPLRLAPDQLDRIAPTPRPITGTKGNRE